MSTSRTKSMLFRAAAGLIAVAAAVTWAQQSDQALVIERPVAKDQYAASPEVIVRTMIDGDLVAAGRRIIVDGEVTGDLIVAAQEIEIRGAVGDDLRASGQRILVVAPVAGHVVAAGQSVTIDQDVGDWAWLTASTVDVRGNIGGDLEIRGNTVDINSVVDGDVDVTGDDLRLGPDAVIRGDLRWRGDKDAEISSEASIEGDFIAEPPSDYDDNTESGRGIVFTLGLIIAVSALFLLFPRPLRKTVDRIAERPAITLVLGFVILVSTPVLALILLISGVGAWLGLTIIGVYLPVLLIGVLAGLFAVSDLGLRRFRPQPAWWQALAAIFVTVIAVGLLNLIPYVGKIAVLLLWLTGVGSVCWRSWVALQSKQDDALQSP